MKPIAKKLFKLGSIGLLALFASQSYAAGYKLVFQSVSTLADAGDAAVVEDAGTNWYNSAGLVDIPRQMVVGGFGIWAHTKFSGVSVAPPVNTLIPNPIPFVYVNSGSATAKGFSKLPLFHYNHPLDKNWSIGLSVVPAWGFTEDYGRNSLVRYNLTRVYTKSLDVAPSLAFRINCAWSIGIGPDFHYLGLQNRVNVRTEGPAFVLGTTQDSTQRFTADNWNYGGHIGVLYRASEHTRIGLNYRSQIATKLDGRSYFNFFGGPQFINNHFKFRLTLPPTTTLSVYHDMTEKWAMMGTVLFDQWSFVKRYHARNIAVPPTATTPDGNVEDVLIQQHMRNVMDVYVGTHYWLSDKLMLRANVKWLSDPTQARFRTVTFPDGPKLGAEIGARYVLTPCLAFDVSYGHVWIKETHINDVNPLTTATSRGHTNTDLNTLGGQIVWTI